MNLKFNIDAHEAVAMTAKLERVSERALPYAVRNTLSEVAKDVKKYSIEKSANKNFTRRQKTFFKASSSVNFARGTDIKRMQSEVGFRSPNNVKNSSAVKELEQQEFGGTIKDRELIPTKSARISNSDKRMVQSRNRLKSGKMKIVHTRKMPSKSKSKQFIQAVVKAQKGGYVETDNAILRVDRISRPKNGRPNFKLSTIYIKNKSGTVRVKATHFMREASYMSYKKIPDIYKEEIQKQLDRYYYR